MTEWKLARAAFVSMTVVSFVALGAAGVAAQEFDNPTTWEGGPCVLMTGFTVDQQGRGEAIRHSARTEIENVCLRSVEVEVCFMPAAAADDAAPLCSEELLRPNASATVRSLDASARLTAPNVQWRFLP